ncbi:MAG: ribonuclease III [Clostridia bacterium]|nr:ribonuclease III [Clostridia bacterium]
MDNTVTSIPALAYYGDAVIELLVRERLISTGISNPGELTKMSRAFVTAQRQSACVEKILSSLTEEESDMFRRGRNMHGNHPKSASVAEYRRATGFEVLMGYLYKTDNCQRAKQLFSLAYEDELNALPSINA